MNSIIDLHDGMGEQGKKVKRTGGRSARVVESVLQAAADELVAVGYEGVTIGAVARRAGVHETSIYRRWKTRDALLAEVGRAIMNTEAAPPDAGSLREDLVALVLSTSAILGTPVGAAIVMACLRAQPGSVAFDICIENWGRRERYIRQIFERALNRGEWAPDGAWRPCIDMLLGAMHFRLVITKEVVDRPYVEGIVDLIFAMPASNPMRIATTSNTAECPADSPPSISKDIKTLAR